MVIFYVRALQIHQCQHSRKETAGLSPAFQFPGESLRIGKCFLFLFSFFFFNFIYLFILFMAVLGLRFCARAFSSCGKRGPLHRSARASHCCGLSVAERRLQTRRHSSCGSRAQPLRGMWDPPRPGLEPVSPALAGRFSTTAPPGKPSFFFLNCYYDIPKERSILCDLSVKGKRYFSLVGLI